MPNLIFSDCGPAQTTLTRCLFQDGNFIEVASSAGFPDISAIDRDYLVVLYSKCAGYSEIVRVIQQNGLLWTIERAQGGCDVPLTFEECSLVVHPFSTALALGLNEIVDCIENP